ncbi:MAG: hypothetical protein ACP5M9_03895 [Candidatus Micrarchaeia archaeon]
MKFNRNNNRNNFVGSQEKKDIESEDKINNVANFLCNNVAISFGVLSTTMDIIIKSKDKDFTKFTYLDAVSVALFSIPIAKKVLDSSVKRFYEGISTQNKKIERLSNISILSTATYMALEGCATYNAFLNGAFNNSLKNIDSSSFIPFALGVAALGVGIGTNVLMKRSELKKYRR